MNQEFKNKLSDLGLDVNKSLKLYFLDDEDFYEKILFEYFLKEDLLALSYKYTQENDIENAFMNAHKLKSQIGYLCFDHLYVMISKVCDILRNKKIDGVLSLLDEMEYPYYKFISILKEYHN